jgi:hypothetical protein
LDRKSREKNARIERNRNVVIYLTRGIGRTDEAKINNNAVVLQEF